MTKRQKEPKLTPKQIRALIAEYIQFDGRSLASCWPAQYADTFSQVRDISSMRYDQYGPNEKRGPLEVAEKKRQVSELTNSAEECRKASDNETTWRFGTEIAVAGSFNAEVVCSTCRKRLWNSDFQALPDNLEDAERLQARRAKRTRCACTALDKSKQDIYERGEPPIFRSRMDASVLHDPADDLAEKGLETRRPDRVVGLAQTKALQDYTSVRQDIRHSPFDDDNVLYPFLIIEAKSEVRSPGFQSIENQTAVPIITLMRLQQNLSNVSEHKFKPLVWFLANMGDVWRVYACVSDGPMLRVIDLWLGSIRSYDGALQLLLIIDCICDWARDIYRFNILRCLARGDVNMRDFTPAESSRPLQADDLDVSPSSSNHSTPGPTSPEIPISIDLTTDAQDDDTEMQDANFVGGDDEPARSAVRADYHHLLCYSMSQNDSDHWSQDATIRHSNLVLFVFTHFAIPEDFKGIEAWLHSCGIDGDISHAAKHILGLLEKETAVSTTMDEIYELEQFWTCATPQVSPRTKNPVCAQIMFKSHLQTKDWQLVRQISCLTGSPRALKALSEVAGKSALPSSDPSMGQDCCCRVHCLVREAQPLRSLSGGESIVCAANNLELRLDMKRQENTTCNWRWNNKPLEKESEGHFDLWSALGSTYSNQRPSSSLYQSSVLEEVSAGISVPPSLAPIIPMFSCELRHGAVLMKKMSYWPAICPTFCFMVFDNTSFDDLSGLVEKIIRVWNSNCFYTGTFIGTSGSSSDHRAIEVWTDTILEIKRQDAEWPSMTFPSNSASGFASFGGPS